LLYETNCSAAEARNRLGSFHFQGDAVFDKVETLSGGEKSRLMLCMLMGRGMNFLMLDEPTNHLDIASREWIESAVEAFAGSLLFISHDRYFISRFATRIWSLENGRIVDFAGTYEEYRQWLELQKSDTEPPPEKAPKKETKAAPSASQINKAAERQKRALEREMAALEGRERNLEAEMEQNASNPERLTELMAAIEAARAEWQGLFEQWEGV